MGWLGGGVERVCNMMTAWTNRCAIRAHQKSKISGDGVSLPTRSLWSLLEEGAYRLQTANSLVSPPAFFAVPEKGDSPERWLLLAE